MQVVFSNNKIPDTTGKESVFLAGPTPRDQQTLSWRKRAIELFEAYEFEGYVFVPEWDWNIEDMQPDYDTQIEWELEALERASIIAFWVPRELNKMPAFTTNVEFGLYIRSGKIIYGRPDSAPKNRYLDKLYTGHYLERPMKTIETLIEGVIYGRLVHVKQG